MSDSPPPYRPLAAALQANMRRKAVEERMEQAYPVKFIRGVMEPRKTSRKV